MDIAKAPAWRRTGANLVDIAAFGGLFWLGCARGASRASGTVVASPRA